MKQTIRLNENELKQLIRESVKTVLKEGCDYNPSPDESYEYDNIDEERDINFVLNVIGKKWNELKGQDKLDKIEKLCFEICKMLNSSESRYKDININLLNSALNKISHIAFYESELYNEKLGRLDKIIEACNREMRYDDYDD